MFLWCFVYLFSWKNDKITVDLMVKEIVPVILLICIVQSIGFQGNMIKKLVIALLSQSSNNKNRQSIIDAVNMVLRKEVNMHSQM